jgi:Putative S-adenosyl-L-methionine-dependent methyltransferase
MDSSTLSLTTCPDSLYNPHYGYFSKQVVIFNPGDPFNFNAMKDEPEFHTTLGKRYTEFEDKLDAEAEEPNDTRQLWHTPTELFRPYYGEAIARYLITNYKLSLYPYHDLIIYEVGAGNGTLMVNILDFIRDTDPEVYARTKFKVIEITPALASLQLQQIASHSRGHLSKVEIIPKSILNWDTYVPEPCFFLALEVIDNFAHDSIRYDPQTEQPLQSMVLIDRSGEFVEFNTPNLDPRIDRFLQVRNAAVSAPYNYPLSSPRLLRKLRDNMPFAPNLSLPEYLPTNLLKFFEVLRDHFPAHRLVVADFDRLPKAVPGYNAPVVQTRYQRKMVPVTTPLVCSDHLPHLNYHCHAYYVIGPTRLL